MPPVFGSTVPGSGTSTSLGGDQRRIWRKLHLGVDEQTKESVAVEITVSHLHDSWMLPSLVTQISGKVCQVSGDGAYDTQACYESIGQRGAKATIPSRRNAKRRRCDHSPEKLTIRDAHRRQIQQQGRYAWRVASGCTRQSLAENGVFRFKNIFARFRAPRFDNHPIEGWITCMVLDQRVRSGIPVSARMQ